MTRNQRWHIGVKILSVIGIGKDMTNKISAIGYRLLVGWPGTQLGIVIRHQIFNDFPPIYF